VVTVRFVVPLIEPEAAQSWLCRAHARRQTPLVIVAREVLDEVQVTELVKFCVLLSL